MLEQLDRFMQTEPEGTLEKIALEYQTNLWEVIKRLPTKTIIGHEHFDKVWQEVTTWGEITFIVNTPDIIAEFSGKLPEGYHKKGYFNMRHTNGLGGHIKANHCAHIAFVKRKFMGVDTAAIIFLNKQGEGMFKIFVGRDEQRNLKADQLTAFDTLAEQLSEVS